jgi:hypothetical protein
MVCLLFWINVNDLISKILITIIKSYWNGKILQICPLA